MARYSKLALQTLSLLSHGLLLGYSRRGKERRELLAQSDRQWMEIDRNQLFHALKVLKMQGLVDIIEKNDKRTVRITDRGKIRADAGLIFGLEVRLPKKWDGKWRIVIFDIPEEQSFKRNLLRQKLKEFNFRLLQKSVFVSPYVCEKEIRELCQYLNLENEVCVVIAKNLGVFEKRFKTYFD